MKRLVALAILSLAPCVTLAAPVPKVPSPEAEAQKNSKLRAYYDQLQQDLGDTAEGQKLRAEVGRAKTLAENLILVERMLFQARPGIEEAERAEIETLENFCHKAYRSPRTPREQELFQLSLWEAREVTKQRP